MKRYDCILKISCAEYFDLELSCENVVDHGIFRQRNSNEAFSFL